MRLIFMSLVMMVNTACISKMVSSAIPQQGKKPEELQKVKSVAIIAFDVLEFKPTGMAGKIAGDSLGSRVAGAQAASNAQEDTGELARDLYDELSRAMGKKGWRVLALEKVAANKMYQELYEAKKPSLLQKAPNHFQKPVVIKGIMRPVNPVYLLKPEERAALAKSLGVDAIVFARVSYMPAGTDHLGLGISSRYLQPHLAFNMYGTGEEPIWFDYSFAGPQSAESIGKVSGMEDAAKIAQLSRPLASETFTNFLR